MGDGWKRAAIAAMATRMAATAARKAPAGLKTQAAPIPTEQQEQEAIFAWRDMAVKANPALAMLISTQPGARVSMGTAMKLKRAGMPKGFPDLALFVVRYGIDGMRRFGLFIELKRRDAPPSAVKPEQREWAIRLEAEGYKCVVCRGATAAIKAIESYLDGEL